MGLRVLHLFDHSVPLQSGYAFRSLAILREQRRLGYETLQVTSSKHYGAKADEEAYDGFHFSRTRPPDTWMRRLPVLDQAMVVVDTARRLGPVIEREQPDLVHAHSPALNGLAALRAAGKFGLPVVYEMRSSWEDAAVDHGTTASGSLRYRVSRMLETLVLRRAAAITTICEGLRADILARGIAPELVTVVPNAVDIADFAVIDRAEEGLRAQLRLGAGPILGFIGSFYAYEGLDLLIAALPELLRAQPRLEVLLVGGGPSESFLRQLARDTGVGDRVHFLGRVAHREIQKYYSLIDILVYPRKSSRLTETVTPLKPLEAMAQGRILIASDVAGHREVIPESFSDHVFRAGDVDDLTRTCLRLLSDRSSWPERARAGRRFVEEQRTWQRSVANYEAVYKLALSRNGWPRAGYLRSVGTGSEERN